jgi:atypical dual specificity phosphatase
MALPRFYWLVQGAVAGCSLPGGRGRDRMAHYDAPRPEGRTETLEEDLDWLRAQGIGAVLSLTETPLDEAALARHGLAALHVPVDDMTAPAPEEIERALGFIDLQRARGRAVAVHCLMGQGRTGTVLAAYLIRSGRTVGEAVRELRAICPGAIGAPEQERALEAFARRRDWIV